MYIGAIGTGHYNQLKKKKKIISFDSIFVLKESQNLLK